MKVSFKQLTGILKLMASPGIRLATSDQTGQS